VCDESSRIKNPDAKRTKRTINLGAVSEYRLILNGTPIALGVQDLWSQYEFLDPNIIGMGDYWSFKTRYIVMGGYEQKQIVGFQNVEELMNLVAPYTAVVGKEVLNLPPKVFTERPVQITPEQKRYLRLAIKGADADPTAPLIKVENTLEKVLRCRQIVGGWLPRAKVNYHEVDGVPTEVWETILEPLAANPKLDSTLEMIEDNFDGSKFIIWSTISRTRSRPSRRYLRKSMVRRQSSATTGAPTCRFAPPSKTDIVMIKSFASLSETLRQLASALRSFQERTTLWFIIVALTLILIVLSLRIGHIV